MSLHIQDIDKLSNEFRRRGFIVDGFYKVISNDRDLYNIALSLSPRLTIKLRLDHGVSSPEQATSEIGKVERLALSLKAIEILKRATDISVGSYGILREECDIALIVKSMQFSRLDVATFYRALHAACILIVDVAIGTRTPNESFSQMEINAINSYFGAKIALYFDWLRCYTTLLSLPSAIGAILFCYQVLFPRSTGSPFMLLFCAAFPFWSTFAQEVWKRLCADHMHSMGLTGYDDEEATREIVQVQDTIPLKYLYN